MISILSLPILSLPFLSLVTSAKDYVEIVHKLMEFHPSNIGGVPASPFGLTDYTEFGSFISYAVLTIKSFFIEILSFNWLHNILSASREIIVPDIASAMISEISVLDGYFHNAFTFLETPLSYGKQNYSFYGLEKFTIGFINSFFLFLPTSAAHVIFFRRLVFQGIEGGYVAGIGIIAGNILWLTSIIFGWRFFVIPWLSLDLLRYLLGFVILIKFMWHASRDKRILTNFSKSKIFFVNFLLAFTEQTNLYPFVTNMSIGAESSILETFPVDNLAQFFFVHTAYIVGLLAGSISLLNLTCWLWENPVAKMFFWLKSNVYMPNFYKNLNYLFLYLTMLCTISSFPYFGLDYTLTNPLGLVSDDRIFNQKNRKTNQAEFPEISFLKAQASDRNARDSRGRHGRRERWKERLIKYRGMDTSLYNQGVYDLFTIEDLNYGFDKFWLRKRIRNHPSRFRMLLIKPQLLSLKKQLAKPRLLTNEGARVEVFRMIYELFYHPNFHAYKNFEVRSLPPSMNKMAPDPVVTSLKKQVATTASFGYVAKQDSLPSLILKKRFNLMSKEERFLKPFERTTNPLNTLNFKSSQSKEANSLSALRKFVRKVNTRIKSSEILLNKNNVISLNKPIYSKQLFSSMQKEKLTKKERQILRYKTKTFWSSPKGAASPFGLAGLSEGSSEMGGAAKNKGALEETLLQVNNAKTMLHPIKFYLQKEKAFRRKLKFYGSSVFRKLSIENNAPYFRIMMKRLFYYYKPTLRWTNTFKLAKNKQGHKVRKKRSRTPLKIEVPASRSQFGGLQSNRELMTSQYNTKGYEASQPVVGNLEKSEFALLMKEPTHNFRIAGKNSSRHRNLIFKQALFNWYYTPFNRILSKLDVDSFIRRQPNSHFLTKKDEQGLHLKRFLLADHYDTLRWYTYMQHYRSMKTKIGGTKSFASKFVYNQQFQGTLKKIRHLFAITPSLFSSPFHPDVRSNQGGSSPFARRVGVNTKDSRSLLAPLIQGFDSFDILKFDQPLYNEYSNTQKKSIINDSVTHEELLSPVPILKTRERGQNIGGLFDFDLVSPPRRGREIKRAPFVNRDTFGNDFMAQSTLIAREYLRTAGPIRQKTIKNFLLKKNYKELTKFILPVSFVSETAPFQNRSPFNLKLKEERFLNPSSLLPSAFVLQSKNSKTGFSFAKNEPKEEAGFLRTSSKGRVKSPPFFYPKWNNQGHALLVPFFKNAGRKKQWSAEQPPKVAVRREQDPLKITPQFFEGSAYLLATQTPLLQVTRAAKNLNVEQDLWFSLLKTYKKGLYDKEFISKFVERRTKKREKRQQKKEKELQNRLKRLQKWLAPNQFHTLAALTPEGGSGSLRAFVLQSKKAKKGAASPFGLAGPLLPSAERGGALTTGLKNAIKESILSDSFDLKFEKLHESLPVGPSKENQTLFDPLFYIQNLDVKSETDKGKVKTAKGLLGTNFIKTKLLLKNNLRLRLRRLVASLSTRPFRGRKKGSNGAWASLGLKNAFGIFFLPKAASFSKMRATEKIKKLQLQNRIRIRRDRMYKNRKGSRKRYTKEIKKAQNDLISASSVPNTAALPKNGVKFNRRISTSLPIQLLPLFRNNREKPLLISKFEESKSILLDRTKVNKSNYPRLKRFSFSATKSPSVFYFVKQRQKSKIFDGKGPFSKNTLHFLEGPLFKNALLRKRGLLPSVSTNIFRNAKNEGKPFLPGGAFERKQGFLLFTRRDEGQSPKSYTLSNKIKQKVKAEVKREKKANNESNDSKKEVPFLYFNTLFKMGGRYEIKQKFRLRKTKNRRNQRFGRPHRGVEHPSNNANLERKTANMVIDKRLQILKQAFEQLPLKNLGFLKGSATILSSAKSEGKALATRGEQPPFNSLTTNRREFAFKQTQTSESYTNQIKSKKSKKLKWKKFKKSINSEKARKARKQSIDAVVIQRAGALTKQMKRIKYNLKLQQWWSHYQLKNFLRPVISIDAAPGSPGGGLPLGFEEASLSGRREQYPPNTKPRHGTWQFEKDRQFKQLIAKLSKTEILDLDFVAPSLKRGRSQRGGQLSKPFNEGNPQIGDYDFKPLATPQELRVGGLLPSVQKSKIFEAKRSHGFKNLRFLKANLIKQNFFLSETSGLKTVVIPFGGSSDSFRDWLLPSGNKGCPKDVASFSFPWKEKTKVRKDKSQTKIKNQKVLFFNKSVLRKSNSQLLTTFAGGCFSLWTSPLGGGIFVEQSHEDFGQREETIPKTSNLINRLYMNIFVQGSKKGPFINNKTTAEDESEGLGNGTKATREGSKGSFERKIPLLTLPQLAVRREQAKGAQKLLANTNPLPFYAGWDESTRKFVVTNRLLSRREAGYSATLLSSSAGGYFAAPLGATLEVASQDPFEGKQVQSKKSKIDFTNAPLQGMNAGTTLYSQVPFTTFDPDQLFSKGMDGFAPIGWRRFEFTHTILKTKALRKWLNLQSKKNRLAGSFLLTLPLLASQAKEADGQNKTTLSSQLRCRGLDRGCFINNTGAGLGNREEIGPLKPLLTKIYKLKKRVINFQKRGSPLGVGSPKGEAAQFSFGKQEHRDIKTANNYSRRLQRHYKRTRRLQNEKAPVFLMSGPLINEVLPVHYINVFNKQNRLSKDRYLKRRLRRGKKGVPKTIQEFNSFTKLRSSFVESASPFGQSEGRSRPQGIYDFTFRRRLKTRRKYHRKTAYPLKRGQGAEVRPRRHKFLANEVFQTSSRPLPSLLPEGSREADKGKVKTTLALQTQMRKRPTRRRSKKRFNDGGTKNQKIKTNSALNSRLRQLRRRVSRQVIKTVPRRRPRAGGFVWPGGGAYLRLEQTESPKLMLKSTELLSKPSLQKGPHKIDKRAILLDLYVQPRKYLLEKHNIKVIKKKLEKAQRTNQIKQRI